MKPQYNEAVGWFIPWEDHMELAQEIHSMGDCYCGHLGMKEKCGWCLAAESVECNATVPRPKMSRNDL